MSKEWSPWECIEKSCSHNQNAVYKVALVTRLDPMSPVCIPRFLRSDGAGVLSIGMTTRMNKRRADFCNGPHSEGVLLKTILHKYTCFFTIYPGAFCVYSYCIAESEEEAAKWERQLIKEYVITYGEVPPLNSAIPDRHNHQEWQEVFSTKG